MPIQTWKCFFNISHHSAFDIFSGHILFWEFDVGSLKLFSVCFVCLSVCLFVPLIWPIKGDWFYICLSFSLVIKLMFLPFRIDPSVTNACLVSPIWDLMSSSVFPFLLTINASKICGTDVSAFREEREKSYWVLIQ